MPETDVKVYLMLHYWLYIRQVGIIHESDDEDKVDDYLGRLIHLWVLADMVRIPALQDETLCQLNTWMQYHATGVELVQHLDYIFKYTTEESQLREYVVDFVATWLLRTGNVEIEDLPDLTSDILRDILSRFLGLGRRLGMKEMPEYYITEKAREAHM